MKQPALDSALKRLPLFGRLDGSTIKRIAQQTTRRTFVANETLYSAGKTAPYLLLPLAGSLHLYMRRDETEQPLATRSIGELWGHELIIAPGTRFDYSIRAGSAGAEIACIPIKTLGAILSRKPQNLVYVLYEVARSLRDELAAEHRVSKLLKELVSILKRQKGETDALNEVLQKILSHTNTERGLVATFDDTSDDIVIETSHNYATSNLNNRFGLAGDTVISRVYNTGEPFIVSPKNFERKFSAAPYARQSMYVMPLSLDGLIGVILIADKQGHEFTPEDAHVIHTISLVVSSLLHSLKQKQAQKQQQHFERYYIAP